MKISIWKEWVTTKLELDFVGSVFVNFPSIFVNFKMSLLFRDTWYAELYAGFHELELPRERLFYRRNRFSYILIVIVTIMLISLSRSPVDWLSMIDRRKCRPGLQKRQKTSFSLKKIKVFALVMLNLYYHSSAHYVVCMSLL